MNYESKPHKIEAFCFDNTDLKPPEWFIAQVHKGRASVTLNDKGKYITLYDEHLNMSRAFLGDWVCRTNKGTLFVLGALEFNESFEACDCPLTNEADLPLA